MTLVRRVFGVLVATVVLLLTFGGGWLTGRLGLVSASVDPASLTDLERQFTERMREVALVGSFTIEGRDNRTPREDRYDIESVQKVGDDLWQFRAAMRGTIVPVVVPIRWVGDTPMILMTDTSLPGLGTFTVRLFFHGDRYAGTWQHGEVGGLMSGRIQRQEPGGKQSAARGTRGYQ